MTYKRSENKVVYSAGYRLKMREIKLGKVIYLKMAIKMSEAIP